MNHERIKDLGSTVSRAGSRLDVVDERIAGLKHALANNGAPPPNKRYALEVKLMLHDGHYDRQQDILPFHKGGKLVLMMFLDRAEEEYRTIITAELAAATEALENERKSAPTA